LAAVMIAAAVAAGQSSHFAGKTRAEWSRFNPVTPLTAATFAHPPAADQPGCG
jgi:hypothetical protein